MEKVIIIALTSLSFLASIVAVLLVWVITSGRRKQKVNSNNSNPNSTRSQNNSSDEDAPKEERDASSCECNCCGALNSLIAKLGTNTTPISTLPISIPTVPTMQTIQTVQTPSDQSVPGSVPQSLPGIITPSSSIDSKTSATIVPNTDGAHQYNSNLRDKLGGAVSKPFLDIRKLMASNSGEYGHYQKKGRNAIQELTDIQTKALALRDTQVTGPSADPTKSLLDKTTK